MFNNEFTQCFESPQIYHSSLLTINSTINIDTSIIAELDLNDTDHVVINSSIEGDLIVVSVISYLDKNKIYVLSKVGDFYIKEKEIIEDDECISKRFGENIAISKINDEYMIAISDTEYYNSSGLNDVGCVFIYKSISGKGWWCVKQLFLIEDGDENRYSRFGNILEFTSNGLVVGCVDSEKEFLLNKDEYSNTLFLFKIKYIFNFKQVDLNVRQPYIKTDYFSNDIIINNNKISTLGFSKDKVKLIEIDLSINSITETTHDVNHTEEQTDNYVETNDKKKTIKTLENKILFIEDTAISDGRKRSLLKCKNISV